MFKTHFSEHNYIWGAQKRFGVTVPECPTVCGPGQNSRQKVLLWGPSCLCSGPRHSENLFFIHNMSSNCRLCKLHYKYFPANTTLADKKNFFLSAKDVTLFLPNFVALTSKLQSVFLYQVQFSCYDAPTIVTK